jgi:O-antigen/teichoic acid export membrane protein
MKLNENSQLLDFLIFRINLKNRLKNQFKDLSQSKFVRNVVIVSTGTAGAQAIAMSFSPIITRLYGPEAFGLLGAFMAILSILVPISAMAYPIAIVLPKSDSEAKQIARLSIYVSFLMSGLVTISILLGGNWLLDIFNLHNIAHFMLLIPLGMLFAAWLHVMQQWLIRKKRFGIISRVSVFQSFIINSVKAVFGWFNPAAAILIILATLAKLLHTTLLLLGNNKNKISEDFTINPLEKRQKISIFKLAKLHYDFPLFRAPQQVLNAVSESMPVLMLSSLFSPVAAGYYVICKIVLGVPTLLIGKSVGDVFYPRINEAIHKGENTHPFLLKATLALAAFGSIPFGIIIIFGPILFSFVFGHEWIIAGEYARWLAIWAFFIFFTRPIVSAIPALHLQGFFLSYEIIGITMRMLAIFIGFYIFSNDIYAVAIFSFTNVLLYFVLIVKVFFTARILDDKMIG